jgi:hypothetical protein
MKSYSLYPRLVVSVGLEFLEPTDRDLLYKLSRPCTEASAASGCGAALKSEDVDNLVGLKVYSIGDNGYLLDQTGADYSEMVQSQILSRWASLRASEVFLGILRSAQVGLIPRIIFEVGGMYPEIGEPPRIGEIGKRRISKKRVRKLLESLRMAYEHYWPIAMLANIVEPAAKRTRRK